MTPASYVLDAGTFERVLAVPLCQQKPFSLLLRCESSFRSPSSSSHPDHFVLSIVPYRHATRPTRIHRSTYPSSHACRQPTMCTDSADHSLNALHKASADDASVLTLEYGPYMN